MNDVDHGKDELWELAVTVPPVTETIGQLLVHCGSTDVVVRQDNNLWATWSLSFGTRHTDPRPDYDGAVADARRWAEETERRRLLTKAVHEVLHDSKTDSIEPRQGTPEAT